MAECRAYIVGNDRHFVSCEGFTCDDDNEAVAKPTLVPRDEKSSQISIMRRVGRCAADEQFCSGRLSALENLCQVSIIEHKAGGTFDLFDNFVGTGQQEWRQGKSDQAGSLRIDR